MTEYRTGDREIRAALAESRRLFVACGLFSIAVNVLMLTGPLFMLQIYDRVLSSRSEATLVTLAGLVAFLFLLMGVLDHARGRVLARVGARLQERLDPRVLRAILIRSVAPAERSRPATGLADLEAILRFASSSGAFTFFDAPWTPVFLFVLFLFHWLLGVLAVFSGCLLLVIALVNQARTGALQREAGVATAESAHFIEQVRAGGETVQGLGMLDAVLSRLRTLRHRFLDRTLAVSDRNGFYGVLTRTLRLFLQSMMLGLGAWLALRARGDARRRDRRVDPAGAGAGADRPGGRLLAAAAARGGGLGARWGSSSARRRRSRFAPRCPPPRAILEAQSVTVAPPGARYAVVRQASLRLNPGQAAGIAGVSASGKSTLARALAGVWAAARRLGCAWTAPSWTTTAPRRRDVTSGYLPQEVVLFEGTEWRRTSPAWRRGRTQRRWWRRRGGPARTR